MRNTKRVLSMILAVCMLLSVLSVGVFAVTITEKPENGTTEGQPFPVGAGGSNNFRIPGIVTLNDGTLIAACDARWNHTGDGAGLDTIVAVSHDNGATWEHTFANYLGDNGNTYNNLSTCIIDPAIGTDGTTAYLIADLFPAGIALNTSKYSPIADENGFDDAGHLLLRALADDTVAIGESGYNTMAGAVDRYDYYLDLETLQLYTIGVDGAEDTVIEGYAVDAWFNIVSDDGTVNTNLFFSDSPYQPYPTDFLYLVTSEDGLTWSEPKLLNLQEDGEQTLLIGPGNGTYDAATDRMIFTAYEYTSGYQRTSLLWMDSEGNWSRTADATGSTWSSEATAVVLDDGTVRCFYRDGYSILRYTDYVWDETEGNYVTDSNAYEVTTQAAKRSNNQLTAIMYSQQIDGKDVILVACASNPDSRSDGYLYVFLVNEDKTLELAYSYDIFSGTGDYYAYNCISEMDDGNIALLYEGDDGGSGYGRVIFHTIDMDDVLDRDNDARLDFVDVSVLTGESVTYTDNSGYYPNPDLSELDTNVATVTVTGSETTTNAAQVLSNGANVDLDACRYTFTANEDGTYVVSNTVGDTTVYLNHYLTSNNNVPNITTAGNIAVTAGSVDGMFALQAQVQEGGSGVARTLHFHAEASTPYWNRCGSDTSYKCQEYLFRKAADGETASTDIPGYVQLTSVDEIEDGGQYLIAAKNDAGNWYVLNPANSSTSLDHIAQIVGSTTVGYTDVTISGVGAGYTEVQIGSTVYRITAKELATETVTIPVGGSVTYTQEGNYANADTSELDTSVATVTLEGSDGANEQGVALNPTVNTLPNGTYVIVNTRANKLVNNTSASADAAAGSMAGLALSGTITNLDATTAVWTITAVEGGYTVQDTNGKYMTIGSNAGGLSDEAQVLTIAYANGTWTLMQNNAYLNDAAGAGTTASGWQNSAAATDVGSQFDLYAYGESVPAAGTTVTFTGVYPGTTGVLIDRVRYEITVTGTVVDVELAEDESVSYVIGGATAVDEEPDASVATAQITTYPAAQLGTDATYSGAFVELADCLYTFTANEDGTYVISSVKDPTIYLEGYSSTNGYPNVTYATNITLGDGSAENSVTLQSYSTSAAKTGYLFFWRDGKNYFDRVTSTGGFEAGVSFHLYAEGEDGTYAAIAGKDAVVDGGQYLIVAEVDENNKFVVYPTTSRETRYAQAAKMGDAAAVTFTGVGEGETTARVGSTIYEITVGHTHKYEGVVTAPTCTEGGYTTYTCSCGDSYVGDETEALGHTFENGVCTVCGTGIAVNEQTGEAYTTLAEALEVAEAGQTVTLLADCTAEKVLVTPNVTLDLNGKTLTADYVVGFNSADIVDNVGTGKIVVAEKNVVLDEGNAMVPVYDGDGYIFTKAGFALVQDAEYTEGFKLNAVACPTNMDVVNLLKDGAADNNLQIMILLTWDTTDGTGSQKFVFSDEVVSKVYDSNDGTYEGYAKMFSMVITGYEGIENLQARAVLVSGTNVEYASSQSVPIT